MTARTRGWLASGICVAGIAACVRPPQAAAAQQTYVVQPGDTLSAIAFRAHTSQWELMRLNDLGDPNRLQAGQVLIVSGDGSATPSVVSSASRGAYGWRDKDYGDRRQSTTVRALPNIQVGRVGMQPDTTTNPSQTTTVPGSEPGMIYIVRPGDTLGALSGRFAVSIPALAAANALDSADDIRIGQRLLIPARTNAAQAAIAPARSVQQAPAASTAPAATTTVTVSGDSAGVAALLTSEAAAYGVDPALVKAVAWQESGWRMVVAADGGIGVMQLMPATSAWVGPALLGRAINPYSLQDNIQAGVALLASYLRQYGGNVTMALAAYNEGPLNLAHGILSSTQQYIASVLALRARFAS